MVSSLSVDITQSARNSCGCRTTTNHRRRQQVYGASRTRRRTREDGLDSQVAIDSSQLLIHAIRPLTKKDRRTSSLLTPSSALELDLPGPAPPEPNKARQADCFR